MTNSIPREKKMNLSCGTLNANLAMLAVLAISCGTLNANIRDIMWYYKSITLFIFIFIFIFFVLRVKRGVVRGDIREQKT